MLKVVSLFCGCGGADLGCEGGFEYNARHYARLPYEIIYATDIDQNAINTCYTESKENMEEALKLDPSNSYYQANYKKC